MAGLRSRWRMPRLKARDRPRSATSATTSAAARGSLGELLEPSIQPPAINEVFMLKRSDAGLHKCRLRRSARFPESVEVSCNSPSASFWNRRTWSSLAKLGIADHLQGDESIPRLDLGQRPCRRLRPSPLAEGFGDRPRSRRCNEPSGRPRPGFRRGAAWCGLVLARHVRRRVMRRGSGVRRHVETAPLGRSRSDLGRCHLVSGGVASGKRLGASCRSSQCRRRLPTTTRPSRGPGGPTLGRRGDLLEASPRSPGSSSGYRFSQSSGENVPPRSSSRSISSRTRCSRAQRSSGESGSFAI